MAATAAAGGTGGKGPGSAPAPARPSASTSARPCSRAGVRPRPTQRAQTAVSYPPAVRQPLAPRWGACPDRALLIGCRPARRCRRAAGRLRCAKGCLRHGCDLRVRRDGWPCGHCCGLGRKGGVGDVEQSWRGAARGDGARGAAFGGLGRALVPRCLCVRGAWRGHRGSCGDGGRGQPQGHGRGLRRRFLEPDPLHHADGLRGHRRLCSGHRADRGAPDRSAGQGPAQRARSGGLCRLGEHAGFAAQLGVFAGVRRPAGARAGPPVPRPTWAWARSGRWA